MSLLKRQEIIEKAFSNFFQANSRMMFQLNQLAEMLKIESDSALIVQNIWKGLKEFKPIQVFKWEVLLNKLIMDFIIEPAQLLKIIQKIECVEENEFDQLLNKKLIIPYKLYLMKRCQFLPKKSQNLDRMYQLMNLIQTATSFSDIIYTFGRYYAKTYPFSADFNIILGNDLNTVYNQMVKYTPKPAPSQILQEYQKIHQKMYIIYYNCYFYKFMKPFVPRWVVTDLLSAQIKNSSKSPMNMSFIGTSPLVVSSNKSLADIATSSSLKKFPSKKADLASTSQFDMSKSMVFQTSPKNNQKFQQSLMLLKSMERVFEQLQDI